MVPILIFFGIMQIIGSELNYAILHLPIIPEALINFADNSVTELRFQSLITK